MFALRHSNFALSLAAFLLCASASILAAADPKPLYQNDFSQADVGKAPDEMMVIEGGFAVQEVDGNKVLQLPGAPLDTFSILFGPSESANVSVRARIHGTKKGRREPAFAVGLNGNSGYRLQVSASKKLLELYHGDESIAQKPFTWESDSWTLLKLQTRKLRDGEFVVEGKAWKHGAPEPAAWTLSHPVKLEPGKDLLPGRASVWGNPFSGTPISYDDLLVEPVAR